MGTLALEFRHIYTLLETYIVYLSPYKVAVKHMCSSYPRTSYTGSTVYTTNAMYNTKSRVSVDIAFVDLYMYTVKYRRTVVIVNAYIFIEISMYI